MPSVLTLEGPKLLGFGTPKLGLLRMNGAIGDALACGGCRRGMGDAAADDNARLATYMAQYITAIGNANTIAKYLGLAGAIVGAIVGSKLGRRFSKHKHAKIGGAIGGAAAIGLGSYYASQSLLMPTFNAPLTTAQQTLVKDLP